MASMENNWKVKKLVKVLKFGLVMFQKLQVLNAKRFSRQRSFNILF